MKPFDKYTHELSIKRWFVFRRNNRRRKLVRKWSLNTDFKKQSISGTWEVEFFNLIPEDDKWHRIACSVMAYVKKNKKVRDDSSATTYLDGIKIAEVKLQRGTNIEIGKPRRV